MLTVGEMVEARANALGTGICIPAPGDVAVVPATVPPSMVEDILRSLGIWDAEVQWAQWQGEGYTDYDLLQVWGDEHPRPISSEEPGAFRVIVLKEG